MSTVKHPRLGETSQPPVEGQVDQAFAPMDDSLTLERNLQLLLDMKAKARALELQLENAKASERNAEQALMEAMLEQGLDSFKALGVSITRGEDIRPSVLAEDRPKQMEWLREIGAGNLISETVNAQSFGALVRNDYIKENKPLPEFIKVYRAPKLLVRTTGKVGQ
jgi:hypothetical protein